MKNKIIKLLLAMIVASGVISFASTTAYCMTDDEWYQTDSGQQAIREGMTREQWDRRFYGQMTVEESDAFFEELFQKRRAEGTLPQVGGSSLSGDSSSNGTTSTTTANSKVNKAHNYSSEITRQANCSEEGIVTYTCTDEGCEESYTETIPTNNNHVYEVAVEAKASCTKSGKEVRKCKLCGNEEIVEVNALGHDFTELKDTVEATCTANGKEIYKCSRCDEVRENIVPAKGHSFETVVVKEASMFMKGKKVTRCSVCNEEMASEEIPSTYPIEYLIIGIIAIVVIGGAIVYSVVSSKKKYSKEKEED